MKKILLSIWFWAAYPFALTGFFWKRRREWRRIVPRIWLSSGEVLSQDLEMYVDGGRHQLGEKFIEDFAAARDELLALIKKQLILGGIVFAYLLSNYFKVGLDINIGGFSLKYAPGVPEVLLLASNLLACYTIILQGNCYLLDSAIKSAIALEVTPELRFLYLVRYFPHETFGGYQPYNLPQIIPNRLHRGLTRGVSILFLLILALTTLSYMTANIFLLLHYLWFNPNFGMWSYILLAYIALLGLGCGVYIIITRVRIPYLDYTINNELAVLEQTNVPRWRVRLDEVYGPLNALSADMVKRGYIKK